MTSTTATQAIDQTVTRILSGPEYHMMEPQRRSWLSPEDWAAIEEMLQWLAQPLLWLYGFSPLLYYLLVAFLVAVTFFLLLRMVRMFRVALDPMSAVTSQEGSSGPDLSPEELEQRAQLMAGQERWDEALRWLIAAAILRLEPKATLRRRGMTNRMYLRRFQRSEFGPALAILVEAFDRVWYGGQATDSTQFEPCMKAYQDLRRMVGRSTP